MSFMCRKGACSLHHGNESICNSGSSIPYGAPASYPAHCHPNSRTATCHLSQQELFEPSPGFGHPATEKANAVPYSLTDNHKCHEHTNACAFLYITRGWRGNHYWYMFTLIYDKCTVYSLYCFIVKLVPLGSSLCTHIDHLCTFP